ncbi:MAG: enoyl-ACP reductase [Pseudomonadota bacterium]
MQGKRGLIMGVANKNSIAWGIAQSCMDQGASLVFTYQNDHLKSRVIALCEQHNAAGILGCDVGSDEDLDRTFTQTVDILGGLDFVLHAIAFSDKNQLRGAYVDTTRDNFSLTMDVSCYSFTAVAKRAQSVMGAGGALLTLTYLGAERYIPNYNVMGVAKAALEASVRYLAADLGPQGIRVNALSAGTVMTRAARGIGGFEKLLRYNEINSAMGSNVLLDQVGNAGAYLLSDLSGGVTGEVHHVDCGYHAMGMPSVQRARENAQWFSTVDELDD